MHVECFYNITKCQDPTLRDSRVAAISEGRTIAILVLIMLSLLILRFIQRSIP